MTFLENEDVLERLHVQYNQEGFPDSIEDSFEDSYEDSYDDSYDDAEFIPIPLLGSAINKGINAVGNILQRGSNTNVNLTGVRPAAVNTSGLSNLAPLVGSVVNAAGRRFQVRVPGAASADSIAKIRQALDAQNANVRKISEAVNKNAAETAKIAGEINRIDAKHTAASKAQNKVLDRLNGQYHRVGKTLNQFGRRVDKLEKNLKDTQSQSQMMTLLPLLMSSNPKIKDITFTGIPQPNTAATVTSANYDSKDDNTFLILALMMGGFGGSGGGGSDMMLPMMLLALK